MATDLQLARLRAVSQNVNYQLSFTPGSDQYTLERWNTVTSAYEQEGIARQLGNPAGAYYRAGVDLTAPAGVVVFQTRGTSSNTTVTLTSSTCGKTKSVVISLTGRVRIQ
ncbi:MAG: GspH/FimT family protein [Candidatus Tectomicrobia bacterium]|uniref:GspH/FimT family protein n=1 Tax=Tectimicrobiota bacterium TaxID=2528274 RepID=A0A932FZB3_UNCTE|nr:GspH/FimT family protein [Candidatus Tectomicrobia bacterium]